MPTQQILSNLLLPLATITEQLFLVIQQFLMSLRGGFKIGSFNDGIRWTSVLALSNCYAMKENFI